MKVRTTEFERSAVRAEDFVRDDLPQVAFAGRSNVGKSSLLNRLVGRKGLARISSTPGRTRAINFFLINSRFHFVDLPGYGYAKVSRKERRAWSAMVDRYLRGIADRGLVIQLVDAKVGATPIDVQAIDYLRSLGIDPIVVATKIDRVPRSKRHAALAAVGEALELDPEAEIIAFSSRSGEGAREVWNQIEQFLKTAAAGAKGA